MKKTKKFVLFVGGQKPTGLLDTQIVRNDFDFTFDFTKTSEPGVFICPQFNINNHRLSHSSFGTPNHREFGFSVEEGFMVMKDADGLGTDFFFEFGGFIVIEQEVDVQLSAFELSKLHHAMSILYSSGSDSLIEIANQIQIP